jgi:replication-associated recombination protein RarA
MLQVSLFKLQTGAGYPFDEVVSALQKAIRRGLEEEAMYWAAELETRYYDYLWKRLQIISVEDIGIADPQAVLYVAEMRRLYQELKKEYDKEPKKKARSFRMALANAILALCRAKKSRIGDEFQIVVYGRREAGWRLEVPDHALDKHTSRGRGMGRGQEHFWSEGVKISNEAGIDNPYSGEAMEIRTKKGK